MAHTFDVSTSLAEATTTPLALNITTGSGATLVVLCICDASTTNTTPPKRIGGNPTFGGKTMSFVLDSSSATANSNETWVEMWYIASSSVGTYEISVPNTGVAKIQLHASSYKAGTGYGSALDVSVKSAADSGANPSLAITPTKTGDVIVGILGSGRNAIPSAQTGTYLSSQYVATHSGSAQYYLSATTNAWTAAWTVVTDDSAIVLGAWKETYLANQIKAISGNADATISKISSTAYSSVLAVSKLGN